jgi:hypothetical protein
MNQADKDKIEEYDAGREKSFHNGDDPEPDDAPGTWGLYIERVDNGYVASGPDGAIVFEDAKDFAEVADTYSLSRLLWHVIEYFGAVGTKHDAHRVRVGIEHRKKPKGPTPIEN